MQVVHADTTSVNTIRAIPITGNYLVPTDDGTLAWAEPNERWSVHANTGGNRQIVCNIRIDDSDHSPDLFLYSNFTKHEKERGIDRMLPKILDQNRLTLDTSREWYIKQFLHIDRVGPKRFTALPLADFFSLWRAPIDPQDIDLRIMGNGMMKFLYREHEFAVYFVWPELQKDMKVPSEHQPGTGRSAIVLPWIQKHCRGRLFLFSDYSRVFEDEDDEFLYTADLC